MISARAEKTAAKYRGEVAKNYLGKRADKEKWQAEDRVVRGMLADLPAETTLLDIPCGTGRFFQIYAERLFDVTALDISEDMLAQAKAHASPNIECGIGNIFALDYPDRCFEVALAVRIMNLIESEDMVLVLKELQRVARRAIIFNLRVWTPGTKYQHAQKAETLHKALQPGWKIARNERIHEEDFRMFMLVRS